MEWEDAPDQWEDAPDAAKALEESYTGRAASAILPGLETGARMIGQIPAYLGGAVAGGVASVLGQDTNRGQAVQQAVMDSPLTNPVGSIPQSDSSKQMDEMIGHGIEWLKSLGGEGAMLARKFGTGALPISMLLKMVPESVARTWGEATTDLGLNAIPMGEAKIAEHIRKNLDTPRPNISAEDKYIANLSKAQWEDAPEQPLPKLDETVSRLPEQGAPAPTDFPILPDAPVRDVSYDGVKLEEPNVPADQPKGLELTPDDRAIPHTPNPEFENVVPKRESLLPEDNLIDALLNKDADAQRVRDMQDNTRTEELRNQQASVDFPLRQEVLEHPAIKKAIDDFRMEAERLKDQPEALAKLQDEFAAGMKQLGIDKASDAYGRAMYESGKGTSLPIEKTVNGVNPVPRDKGGFSDFARSNWPDKPRIGGKFAQRGSIGDPNFIRFKNKLPANMKGRANELYKDYQESLRNKLVETTPGSTVERAVSRVPGMNKIVEEIAPIDQTPWKTIKEVVMTEPDTNMGLIGRSIRTGAQLTGFEKKSTLIRYAGDVVNNASRISEANIRNILLNKDGVKDKLSSLPKEDQRALWQGMQSVEGKPGKPDMSLWTDKMKEAFQAFREANDKAFHAINEGREARGYKPLEYRENHLPSRWDGDFSMPVYDKEGNLVTMVTTKTRIGARIAAAELQLRHPEYTIGDISNRSMTRRRNDIDSGMREIMDNLALDDPRVESIQSALEEIMAKQAYEFNNFKKHFKAKRDTPMGGFEGGKEWINPDKNALEGLTSSMKYMEQAFRWSEMQKAAKKMKEVLADPEIQANHPNTHKFISTYWSHANGEGTRFTRAVDTIIDEIAGTAGIGGSVVRDFNKTIKTALTIKFLGFTNGAYAGSQAWQPVQMIPHWMTYLEQKGATANRAISTAKAAYDVHAPKHNMSDFGKEAYEWAQQNHIADSYIIDEIRNAGSKPWIDATEAFAKMLPAKLETYSRYSAYMTYAHYLHDSGVAPKQAMETAAKLTDMSMTNYHQHERPALYKELGAIGDIASSFTTFKHNQWQQMAAMGVKGRKMSLLPMIGIQLASAGLLGFYGRDEIDSIIKTINENAGLDFYIPTTKEMLLKMPEKFNALTFGGVSTVSGMDMTSRMGASDIFPNGVSEFMFPFLSDIKKMATTAGDVINRKSDEAARAMLHAWSPTSLKFLAEEPSLLGSKGPTGMPLDPSTDTGAYRRTTGDRVMRGLGGYSVAESKARQALMEEKAQTRWQTNLRESYIQKAKDADGDEATIRSLATKYEKANGDVETFVKQLEGHVKQQTLDSIQQAAGTVVNTRRQADQYNRVMEYFKK